MMNELLASILDTKARIVRLFFRQVILKLFWLVKSILSGHKDVAMAIQKNLVAFANGKWILMILSTCSYHRSVVCRYQLVDHWFSAFSVGFSPGMNGRMFVACAISTALRARSVRCV